VFFLLFVLPSFGQQNLILNGDFEEYWQCPDDATQIERCKYVYNPCATAPSTSDYYNVCYTPNFGAPVGVPINMSGFQYTKNGNGMTGFACSDEPDYHYREYIQVSFSETMKCGVKYRIEGYINLSNLTKYTIKNIGFLFSEQRIDESDFLYNKYTPQIIDGTTIISDTLNWTKVSYEFVADAPYSFVTIGHFLKDSSDSYIEVNPSAPLQEYSCYFYLDDFSMIELEDVAVNFPNVFTPNGDGINDYFQPIDSNCSYLEEITILNRWGNNVSTLKFPYLWDGNDEQGNRVTQGVYYYLTKKKNSCKNKKEQAGMIHVIY
jgi:gliding motility-associated-like protein